MSASDFTSNHQPEDKEVLAQHKKHAQKRFWFGFGILLLLVGTVSYFRTSESKPAQEVRKTIQTVVAQPTEVPTPTHYPFYDLTIPSLRDQTYDGTLIGLEEVDTNESYTSYVASYESEGLTINGLLTEPTGEPPEDGWPAIVFVHGYIPPDQYTTSGRPYEAYYDFLAREGFVVYKIDLRGHGDSEGEARGAYYSADYVIDTLNAYAALQSADFVNPERIGIWGHSMSGNVAMRSLATKSEIPAIVIWAGAVYSYDDWEKYGLNDASYRRPDEDSSRRRMREQIEKLYGEAGTDNIFWKQMAPTNYLDEVTGAIELHHAVDDDVVDIGYSRDLALLLEENSIEHELYEYDSGGHNITGGSFITAMERTAAFFKENL